jgi:hypothetical protein
MAKERYSRPFFVYISIAQKLTAPGINVSRLLFHPPFFAGFETVMAVHALRFKNIKELSRQNKTPGGHFQTPG